MSAELPAYKLQRIEDYVAHVRERALSDSGSEGRAEVAAQEARAQATGDLGEVGVAAFRRWLVETGRLVERHIVAFAILETGNYCTRAWHRWSDGSASYTDMTYSSDGRTSQSVSYEGKSPSWVRWQCAATWRYLDEMKP